MSGSSRPSLVTPEMSISATQRDRLVARGINIAAYPLSHLAVRVLEGLAQFKRPVSGMPECAGMMLL